MAGARIERVILRRAGLRYPFGHDFAERLEGRTVTGVSRRAKYLVAALSSGEALLMHLGMSGWFHVSRGEPELGKHDHVIFEMSSGTFIVFNDPRRFGFMKMMAATDDADALPDLGPEPLDRRFTPEVLASALRGKKTTLKAALLDQRVVAGLGNIYVSEALHRARLSPKRRASTLVTPAGGPRPGAVALVEGIRAALTHAIERRHRAYVTDRFRVYEHEAERCPRRGCGGTIKRITQGGRSTYFCPACQK